jgi:Domain of unknown function (DUF4386)
MSNSTFSSKKKAKLAGLFYLLNVVAGVFGLIYVSSIINISGNSGNIVNNLLKHELLFRFGILIRLVSSVPWLLLAITLYRLFKEVNSFGATLMFAWMTLSIPIGFIAEGFNICGLMIAKGELLKSTDLVQKQEYVMLLLNTYNYIISISELFWGLWLIPFGFLIYRSGFIPRLLGGLLLLGGIGYIIDFSTFLVFPIYKLSVGQFTLLLGSAGEITIMLWLLIKGVSNNTQAFDKSY